MNRGLAAVLPFFIAAALHGVQFDSALEQALEARASHNRQAVASRFPAGVPDRLLLMGEGDPAAVEQIGGIVQTRVGAYFTVLVPADALASLPESPSLKALRLGEPFHPLNNLARGLTSADSAHAAGYTGNGVFVGIADTGIDWSHPDFKLESGRTRIVALWDQTDDNGSPPSGFSYGRVWTSAQIDSGLCTETDYDFHGTHVAGIAAGNGSASSGLYAGAAPEANLLFVKVDFSNPGSIADAVNWLFSTSRAYGKPCVINLSLGTQSGSHTAKDPFNIFIDTVVEYYGPEGNVIVWAAGNEGADFLHASNRVDAATNTTIDIQCTTGSMSLDLWYPDRSLSAALLPPGSSNPVFIDFSSNYYSFARTIATGVKLKSYPDADERKAELRFSSAAAGLWKLTFAHDASRPDVHAYLASYDRPSGATNNYFPNADLDGTVSATAVQNRSVCVGAYAHRKTVTNFTGNSYFSQGLTNGNAAWFSSRGPSRDGRLLPDISAPGAFTYSVMASNGQYFDSAFVIQNGRYLAMEGTSMAAPCVTGLVALMLEKDPRLTSENVKSFLHAWAKGNAYKTDPRTWDPVFGYGMADIAPLARTPSWSPKMTVEPRSTVLSPRKKPGSAATILVRSNGLSSGTKGWAKISDGRGGTVMDFGAFSLDAVSVKEFVWDARDASGALVSPGVYYALVSDGVAVSRTPLLVLE